MSSFNWQGHIHEEYGEEESLEMQGAEQSGSAVSIEGKTTISLGGSMFFVELPEKFVGDVRLIASGPDTPEESYRLAELLRCLKQRRNVQAADGRDVRREFVAGLKQREREIASQLRQRLSKEAKN